MKTLAEKEYAEEGLKELFKETDLVYYKINHVARSGMSRSISFYVATIGKWKNDKPVIQNITGWIASIMGKKIDSHNGITVSGCGMDMGFHVINNLSIKLYCPDKYEHEKAFYLKAQNI